MNKRVRAIVGRLGWAPAAHGIAASEEGRTVNAQVSVRSQYPSAAGKKITINMACARTSIGGFTYCWSLATHVRAWELLILIKVIIVYLLSRAVTYI